MLLDTDSLDLGVRRAMTLCPHHVKTWPAGGKGVPLWRVWPEEPWDGASQAA